MKKNFLSTLLLLCAAAQGAWADDLWDGSVSRPAFDSSRGVYVIKKGAELAYIHQHWADCYQNMYSLEENLDLSRFIWVPLGQGGKQYEGTFYGNGHTINLVIENATANYQGLFADIDSNGKVLDLHLSGNIQCNDSRLVGGIAGQNDGDIVNCWVSASVSSNWTSWTSSTAKVGGIVGENNGRVEFCCMSGDVVNNDADVGGLVGYNSGSGTVNHCTFYGNRYSNHKQDNVYIGSKSGNQWNTHGDDLRDDATLSNYLSSFSNVVGCDLYRFAIMFPNPVNIYNEGYGALESPFPGAREGKTFRLTKAFGSLKNITITDAYGNKITPSGNETDGYTFTVPRFGVVVEANFDGTNWLSAYQGTVSNPYLIKNTEDWNAFAYYVSQGNNFYGNYVKLENDITITKTVGLGQEFPYGMRPFRGIFLGNGKTLTANLNSTATGTGWNEEGVAPFHFTYGAEIQDLTVAGTINSASYHTAGIVGFAFYKNHIENCTVTATLNISSNYAGGIIGHGENSATTIKDCVFAGTINGVGGNRANVGGFWGWSNSGNPVFINCLEKGTYNNISSMHPIGLHGATGSITDCFYLNPQIGTPDQVGTVAGAYQVQTSVPEGNIYKEITAADSKAYFLPCEVSGVKENYMLMEASVEPRVTVTCKGTTLVENTDYAVAYGNNRQAGNASVTISGKGSFQGRKTMSFSISNPNTIDNSWWWVTDYTLHDGHTYKVVGLVELENDRIPVQGNVVLYLSEGSTLVSTYGIEVGENSTLTIDGPGTLKIGKCDNGMAGIGATRMGTVIINGGNIDITAPDYAAGIGGSRNSAETGRIIINGGTITTRGGFGGAGIGGGYCGGCGDIIINGGQVTAIHGREAECAIGHGAGIGGRGTLTLSWTNPDDFVKADGDVGVKSITYTDGKLFALDGTTTIATSSNLKNNKIVPYVAVPELSGDGSAQNPYTISTADEWNRFANSVKFGNSFSGQYVQLTADINVTQQCGYVTGSTPCKAFRGTFLGQGHTITANISDNGNQGTALFCYINGATIKNLTVAGTVVASQSHTGGLVGFADGTNLIEGCTVTATLNIRSDYAGGIIGHGRASNTTVKNCIFAGTITGVAGNRSNVGGIYGWDDDSTPSLQNCMEKGTYTNISSMHPIGMQLDKATISRCYYLNPARGIANAGTINNAYKVSTTAIEGEISRQMTLIDGNTYYVPCSVSNIEEYYELAQGGTLSITPTVKQPDGTPLSFSTDYTTTLDNVAMASSTASVTAKGAHKLVLTGAGAYSGSKTFSFNVIDPIQGTGTADDPYVIRNAAEWELFATLVNRGVNDFNGQYVQLGTDLTVTTMAGMSADKAFKGTFLGDGKTLTFNAGSASAPFGEEFCAPFRYVDGATIRDLKVTGDIYTSKNHAAGLVGSTAGTTTITGCQVNTIIHSVTYCGFHGGFVGMPSGPITITDCIYAGRMFARQDTSPCSGFVGWGHSQTINISSSLYAPNAEIVPPAGEYSITLGSTFVRGSYQGSIGANCFYTQTLNEVQGKRIYTEAVAGELNIKAQAADGLWYYLPVTVSGIKGSYTLEGAPLSITPTVKGYGEANPAITTDYTATLNGNPATFPLSITQKGNYTLVLTAVEGATAYTGSKTIQFVVNTPLAGQGTEASPYLIGDADDWNHFATKVEEGETYNGKFLKLNADISVSTMVGTNSAHSFSGTFLGQDAYTLTFTRGSAETAFGEEYCAPFRYVNGATIRGLRVAGDIYTSRKFAAGLVGRPSGSTTITDCWVSTVIHSTVSGDGTHGGIVAMPSGALTITDCIYDGRLLTTNGTTHCGGFVGWHNGQTVAVSSSLYAPNTTVLSGSPAETAITVGATFVRGGSVGNYCYYTTSLGEAQGIQVSANRPDGELCMQARAADNKMYYLPCTVGGIQAAYDLEEDVSITPAVTGLGTTATFGSDFTATMDGNNVESFPISTTEAGDHTLVLTGKGDNYYGSKTIHFAVLAALAGQGTEASPFLISSANEWALFATKVASGMDYSGKYVRLETDITITTPVGEREDKPFSGIFLGNGKTLTADITNTDADAQGIAPFRYIKDAIIQNVTVAGTIASNSRYTAGLVGFADGTNTITNSTVTATLNVGSDYAAGFVGNGLSSNTTLQNCIFVGTINGVDGNRDNMAGIWGLGGTPTLTDCMEKGTYTNVGSLHPIGLQSNAGSITGCYYLTAQMGAPDHVCTVRGAWLVSATATDGEIYKRVTAGDGNTYYMSCTIGGVKNVYAKSGDVIALTPTATAADGTVLTAGTDFTYTTNPATVKEPGDYTLTITAKGSYTGIKSIPFSVSSNLAVTSSTTVMTTGSYTVFENVTIEERINISGNVVLNLSEGTKLKAQKGIELSKGNKLTINGPGALAALHDGDNAGIGAVEVGTLVINGGRIDAFGLKSAAIGGSKNNISGGSITINGGTIFAMGNLTKTGSAAIGGGYADQPGNYGVCGDIVINGGQVTAFGVSNGIGPGYHADEASRSNSGSLTLGWTNPDDNVYITRLDNATGGTHVQSLSFAPGKRFIDNGSKAVLKATTEDISARVIVPLLAPTDDGNNSELISACNGMKLPVMLDGRTLYKDGSWNTLCLPFNVALNGSPLNGAVARPLESASISGSTLNLTFGNAVDTLVAGTPYIIKWASGDNIVSPVFMDVTIDATDRSYDNGVLDDERVRFLGTYESIPFSAENKSILLMGEKNTLYYPTTGAGIGAQRAYFKIGGDGAQAQANARRLKAFSINFGDDEATGIISITPDPSVGERSDYWYTLDGRRLADKPAQSGVYINNGKKVMIK